MQPSVDTFSTAPLRGVRYSFMEDVEGMQTILLKEQIVSEHVNQVWFIIIMNLINKAL